MKILVVDDELVSRKKLQKIMEGFGECETAKNGESAVKAFKGALEKKAPFDIITLDISMPDMDGTEVLLKIRATEEDNSITKDHRIKILMVTSNVVKDMIITCIQAGCDDYIAKPFNKDIIEKKLKKFNLIGKKGDSEPSPDEEQEESGVNIIEEITSRFKSGDIELPSLPQVATKFREMVSQGANLNSLAELLKQDLAISSKLISVSNSPVYRGLVENASLEQALNRLGLEVTRQYVDVICNRTIYNSNINKKYIPFIEKLWEHSLACAYASQIIVETTGQKFTEDAFTVGLFHDIGKLVLLQIISEFEKKGKFDGEVNDEELHGTLSLLHGEFGAALLKRWRFPKIYFKTAIYHDKLEKADPASNELHVVHFANLLVKSMGYSYEKNEEIDLEKIPSNEFLKFDSEKIDKIKEGVQAQMNGMKNVLT